MFCLSMGINLIMVSGTRLADLALKLEFNSDPKIATPAVPPIFEKLD